ncbi:MAG: isocitrate/isopropylmalate dehydrogenase family protein [Caldiserica bacterium]|nr:MAG: isocitrate/isopropylmalate dehydrogenase family protein [Caldisericota bacterium]
MKEYTVTLIPGDGIGPEITEVAKKVIEATGINIKWEIVNAGEDEYKRSGKLIPEETLKSIEKNKVALKGPITTPVGSGFRSVNVFLRKKFDLYACVRPCKSYGKFGLYSDIDIVVIRENTEDLYSGIEFKSDEEEGKRIIEIASKKGEIKTPSGISLKVISEENSERIIRFAFEYAKKNNRKKVTCVHKANIMKYSDGLFLEVFNRVSKDYPEIEKEDKIVDNMCMQLVKKPHLYDVLVLPNLYGDIISDLCAGLVGGLGLAPGANIGKEIAIFEATHGSAPKYKGMNKVNPFSIILSGKMMLEYLGEKEKAEMIEDAVKEILTEGKVLTYDLGGSAGTKEVGEEIIRKIESRKK